MGVIVKHIKAILSTALFALLILAFASWGIQDYFTGGGAVTEMAEIEGQSIGPREVTGRWELYGPGGPGARPLYRSPSEVLDALITEYLFAAALRDLGLRFGETAVTRTIAEDRRFQDEQGRFLESVYDIALRRLQLTDAEFRAQTRRQMAARTLFGAIDAAARAPDSLARALIAHAQERRAARYLRLPADSAEAVPEPEAAALESWLEAHGQRYATPEYRSLTVLVIDETELIQSVTVPEDALKDLYRARTAGMEDLERRRFRQVRVAAEETARRIAERARNDAQDLAEIAEAETEGSAVVSETDLLGPGGIGDPTLSQQAFAIEPGGTAGPVQARGGLAGVRLWRVLELQEIVKGPPPLSDMREELAAELRDERAAERVQEVLDGVRDILAGGGTLEEAAAQYEVRLVEIDSADRRGRLEAGGEMPDLPDRREILDRAFELEPGARSRPPGFEAGMFVVRVDELTPSRVPELTEIRARVEADWRRARRREAVQDRAEALLAEIEAGMSLDEIAAREGFEIQRSAAVTRRGETSEAADRADESGDDESGDDESGGDEAGNDEDEAPTALPAPARRVLFEIAEPGTARRVGLPGGDQMLLVLAEIRPAAETSLAAALPERRARLSRQLGREMMFQLHEGLRGDMDVKIHGAALDSIRQHLGGS